MQLSLEIFKFRQQAMEQNHYDNRQEDKEAEGLFDWMEEQGWLSEET